MATAATLAGAGGPPGKFRNRQAPAPCTPSTQIALFGRGEGRIACPRLERT